MVNAEEKIYSVSEINSHVKDIIECSFNGYVIVEGEISQLNKAQSGHIYITLKDETSSVKCTLWSARVSKMQVYPKVGLKALIKCKVSFYEKNGTYQLDIVGISSVSTGKFHELFEKLKLKLKDEGLFDIKFKKNLPKYPKSISVITSLTGSVIQDILKIIERRLPGVAIEIYACNVQGENCPTSIIKQLIEINKKNSSDVIIIARGGGSLEDLIGYNDEYLARQIYNSKIPIITAVGHETDTTLIDFVSDLRAPTPTGAAEKSVPVREELRARISELDLRLKTSFFNKMNNNKDRLNSLIRLLGKPDQIFDTKNQKLDFVFKDIENLFKTIFTEQKNKIVQYTQKLTPPKVLINNLDSKIHLLDTRFNNYLENVITSKGTKLNSLSQLLEASSFNRVLDRGFALVMDNDGKAIKLSSEVAKNSNVKIKFADETRSAKID